MTLTRPTLTQLRELIETPRPDSPWEAIQRGQVFDECADYTEQYSDIFTDAGIDHVTLEKFHHHYVAVHTSDHGVVLFDPTFSQFFHHHPGYYFLGSPKQLQEFIDQHGGMDSVIEPYASMIGDKLTFRQCFTGQDINMQMDVLFPYDMEERKEYARPYEEALKPLHMYPKQSPWANYVKERSERSSSEVSP